MKNGKPCPETGALTLSSLLGRNHNPKISLTGWHFNLPFLQISNRKSWKAEAVNHFFPPNVNNPSGTCRMWSQPQKDTLEKPGCWVVRKCWVCWDQPTTSSFLEYLASVTRFSSARFCKYLPEALGPKVTCCWWNMTMTQCETKRQRVSDDPHWAATNILRIMRSLRISHDCWAVLAVVSNYFVAPLMHKRYVGTSSVFHLIIASFTHSSS